MIFPYRVCGSWGNVVRMNVSTFGGIGYITQVGCGGHRTDVRLVEPLILEFGHPIETRRGNGKVASIDLTATT